MAPVSSRSPRTASAPASSTACTERSDRASARTVQPSAARRRMSAPPTNPEPPVTNAVAMARSYRFGAARFGRSASGNRGTLLHCSRYAGKSRQGGKRGGRFRPSQTGSPPRALVRRLLERIVERVQTRVQRELDQAVGQPGVLREERSVQVGADDVAAP